MQDPIIYGWIICCMITVIIALIHLQIADRTLDCKRIETLENRYECVLTIELIIAVLYFVVCSMTGGTV